MILLGCIRGFRGVLVVSPFLFGVALLARNLGSSSLVPTTTKTFGTNTGHLSSWKEDRATQKSWL